MAMSSQRKTLAPETVLDDRFRIRKLLGVGGFGEVYEAQQLVFGKPLRSVALKLFSADAVGRDNLHEVFNDAIVLLSLQEKGPLLKLGEIEYAAADAIVKVYDIGVLGHEAPRPFMSMELIHGGRTLANEITKGRASNGMSVLASLNYLRQLLIPLAWMHTLDPPVVHRDLKPENVLLTDDFKLTLTDFGLASSAFLPGFGGTLPYDAPEKLLRAACGEPADVYAIGLIWYELLTGRHPFDGVGLAEAASGDMEKAVEAHHKSREWPVCGKYEAPDGQRIPPPSEINPEIAKHPILEEMLKKCLAFKQSERFFNARAVLESLEKYLQCEVSAEEVAVVTSGSKPAEQPHSVDFAPDSEELSVRMMNAAVFEQRREYNTALSELEHILDGNIDDVLRRKAMSTKACVLVRMGRKNEGQKIWQEAVKSLDPKSPERIEYTASFYRAMGQDSLAKQLETKAKMYKARNQAPRR